MFVGGELGRSRGILCPTLRLSIPSKIEEWIAVGRMVRALLEWLARIPPGTPISEQLLRQRPGS